MSDAPSAASAVARRLAEVPGVVAVVLGGSWARGAAGLDSDVDLGLYYRRTAPPDVSTLRRLARDVAGPAVPPPEVTELGAWGPWVNGGAWLSVDGRKMDWVYREIEKVERVIEDCRAGIVTCDYYLGPARLSQPHLRRRGPPWPAAVGPRRRVRPARCADRAVSPALKDALVRRYLYDARFMLALAQGPARRGDVFHVAGCLFRCSAAIAQVLLAVNERYFTNEKGVIRTIDGLPRRPASFGARVTGLHAAPGAAPDDLQRSLREMQALIAETAELAAPTS